MVTEVLLNAEVRYIQHLTKNSIQIFPEMKLRGLVPNFCIHVYIPKIGPPIFAVLRLQTNRENDRQIHKCRTWEQSRSVSIWEYLFQIFDTVHLQ
jgi:hypothetical protein